MDFNKVERQFFAQGERGRYWECPSCSRMRMTRARECDECRAVMEKLDDEDTSAARGGE